MIRKILTMMVFYSGLPWIIRTFFLRKKVTIIYYHNISDSLFNQHLELLDKWFNAISLKSFVYEPDKMPYWPLIVTFDDGYNGNYFLLETFKKYKLPVTIFLITGMVGQKRKYWFKHMDQRTKEILKAVSNEERIKLLREMNFKEIDEFDEGEGIELNKIFGMLPFVEFQSHTRTHPILTNCTGKVSAFEIGQSKLDVEKLTGKSCYALAFPDGAYSEREIRFTREAGYACALTCEQKFNNIDAEMFRLGRISASDTSSKAELALRITGIWVIIKKIITIFRWDDKRKPEK